MSINNNNKPLIFLGSSYAINKLTDVCEHYGIEIAGIIDNDYWGNTPSICEVPVIDTEESFNDPVILSNYQQNYNFFCATNWLPNNEEIAKRNKAKRMRLLELIENYNLNCISLVDPTAKVSRHATIGQGVFIDSFVLVEPKVVVGDFTNIYAYSGLGHSTRFDRNCVVQRHCSIAGDCVFEHDTFLGTAVKALKPGAVFGASTFVHEGVYIRRGTVENEEVSITGNNLKRVQAYYVD